MIRKAKKLTEAANIFLESHKAFTADFFIGSPDL